jgi:hypothetical protein
MPYVESIALGQNEDRHLELVAMSGDDQPPSGVWHAWQHLPPDDRWTPFRQFGDGLPSGAVSNCALAVVTTLEHRPDRRLNVFLARSNGTVWHRRQTAPNNGWSAWRLLDPPGVVGFPDSLAVAQNRHGCLEVFVMDEGGTVWHDQEVVHNGDWLGWRPHGHLGHPIGGLLLGSNDDGRLELFAPTESPQGDQAVWHRWQHLEGGWSDWHSLERPSSHLQIDAVSTLSATVDGRLELFTVASDGAVWHRWQLTAGGGWSAWSSLGAEAGGFVDIGVGTSFAGGGLVLAATTRDGSRVGVRQQLTPADSKHWTPWTWPRVEGTRPIDLPRLAVDADRNLVLFLRGPAGDLYQLSQTADGMWKSRSLLAHP